MAITVGGVSFTNIGLSLPKTLSNLLAVCGGIRTSSRMIALGLLFVRLLCDRFKVC
jgi:hypothetical protein